LSFPVLRQPQYQAESRLQQAALHRLPVVPQEQLDGRQVSLPQARAWQQAPV
jgi:hypothetical protein